MRIILLWICIACLSSCIQDEYLNCTSVNLKDSKGEWKFTCYEPVAFESLDSNMDKHLTPTELSNATDALLNPRNKGQNRAFNDGLFGLNRFSQCITAWDHFDFNKDGRLDTHEFISVQQQLEYEILSYHDLYQNTLEKAKKRKSSQVDNTTCQSGNETPAQEYISCSLKKNGIQFSIEEENQLKQLKLGSRLFCNQN